MSRIRIDTFNSRAAEKSFIAEKLAVAVATGRTREIEFLLAQEKDAASLSYNGETMLMIAAKNKRPAIFKLLLKKGADTEATDATGLTVRRRLLRAGQRQMIDILHDFKQRQKKTLEKPQAAAFKA